MTNIKHILLSGGVFTACLASCSQQDLPTPEPEDSKIPTITVSDAGYISDSPSRASENGYRTEFAEGDACGLYIVQDGEVVVSNHKFKAFEINGSLQWKPAELNDIYIDSKDGIKAFLYYPYQQDMTGKVDATASDDARFFAPLISSWQPKADQSDYATGYTASDLMTSTGTVSASGISFTLTHRMALAVINLPTTVYKFQTEGIPDYIAGPTKFMTDAKPLSIDAGTFRYIVNPAAAKQPDIIGSYVDDKKEFIYTPSGLEASKLTTLIIGGGHEASIEKTADYKEGDFFCSTADASGWYIIPQNLTPGEYDNCIGIVFKVGRDETDQSDYTKPLNQGGPVLGEVVHGYVMALTDVNNNTDDQFNWAMYNYTQSVGTTDSYEDWNGYGNCLKIHEFVEARSNDGYNMKCFGALFACENYGNRILNNNLQYTDAYAWQKQFRAPANTSGWFLPSGGQLIKLVQTRSFLDTRIQKAADSMANTEAKNHIKLFSSYPHLLHVSSSEWDGTGVYAVSFNRLSVEGHPKYGSDGFSVRTILAF